MKKVALFFGSFNPSHIVHKKTCLKALEYVDEVYFVPTLKIYRNNSGKILEKYEHRLELLRILIGDDSDRIKILDLQGSDRELKTDYDKIIWFKENNKEIEVYGLFGLDNVYKIVKSEEFVHFKEVLKGILVHHRDDIELNGKISDIKKNDFLIYFETNENCNSTEIREKLLIGEKPNFLTDEMFEYIRDNKLFNYNSKSI